MDDTVFQVNNKNAVIYARYSSDRQNEQSIEGQVRVINDYATKNNIPIIDSYIDRALTGRSDDRPEFQRMIADAKKRGFGYVLVYKFDRFSRDRYNSLMYKRELKKNGVKVLSVTEYISDDPQGILLESIIDGYSEFYSAELAQKVRRGNRESRLKGQFTGGLCLFGYKVVDKKYTIVPEEAAIVKEIFTRLRNMETYKQICEDLNSRGIQHHGSSFTVSYLSKLIKNEKYIGKCWIKGELYENIVPPLLDEDLFRMIQKNLMENQRRSTHFRAKINYLLSGKAFCGCCGKLMIGASGTSSHKKVVHTYYSCSAHKNQKACSKKNIKQAVLEEKTIAVIKSFLFQTKLRTDIARKICEDYNAKTCDNTLLKANESAIIKNRKELENVMNLVKRGIFSDTIQETLQQLEEQKRNLEIENIKLQTKSGNKITPEDVDDFLESMIALDTSIEENRELLVTRFVRKVIVNDEKIEVEIYPLNDPYILSVIDKESNNNNSGNDDNDGGIYIQSLHFGGFEEKSSSVVPSGPPNSQKPNP